ncbi:hypothetical protein QLX67_09900 [Balneolaceae bacterium ANBcel3]|nr:hypothetical protein [Balneolaceae bacterium ANBcel3]
MAGITRIYGILLFIIGMIGYILTSGASFTALIPSVFGMIFVVLGRLAQKESYRKHVMHAAVIIAVIALAGSFTGIPQLFSYVAGNEEILIQAALSRAIMAILTIGYIALAVRSFIQARQVPQDSGSD